MTHDTAGLLAELRQDHRNMAILLDLLQEEIERVHENESADFELLQDIMRYMTVYSDAMHHPKEDLIYAGLRAEQPALAAGLEIVEDDHRQIAELSEQLRDDIEAVVSGTAVTRERIIADAKEYLRRLRRHMAWEEEELFRRADELADSLTIDVSHLTASDPVFGAKREASFANLLQTIQREAL